MVGSSHTGIWGVERKQLIYCIQYVFNGIDHGGLESREKTVSILYTMCVQWDF